MNVEFFLFDASLDDHLPKGYALDQRLQTVCAPQNVEPVYVQTQAPGCVALLFGRTALGKTVCVRVEGVHPVLYFDADTAVPALTSELDAEVRGVRGGGVVGVEKKTFARLYGYDPQPDDPSKLRGHDYYEVSYSSLAAWRAARRLRYLAKVRKLQRMLQDREAEAQEAQETHDRLVRGRMTGAVTETSGVEALLARLAQLRNVEIPTLRERLDSYDDEDKAGTPSTKPLRLAHEMHVEPLTAFLQNEGVAPASWIAARGEPVDVPISSCDIELVVPSGHLRAADQDGLVPHVCLYWDIETSGLDPNEARVLQVGMVFAFPNFDPPRPLERHIVSLGTITKTGWLDPDVIVHECDTEEEVLSTFAMLVREKDPDFVHVYNGVNFDNTFMARRAELLDVPDMLFLSRTPMRPCQLREQKLSSGGRGDNKLRYFNFSGRVNIEQFCFFSVEFTQENSYKLDHFAKKLVNDQKKPMEYTEIVPSWEAGPEGRARIADYCLHDCVLLFELDKACKITLGTLIMARTVDVQPEQVYFRGQQLRFVAQMRRRARARADVVGHPQIMNEPAEGFLVHLFGKFKGATVNEPIAGFYTTPVVVLDWASLYPSLMTAWNLSHDSLVLDPALQSREDVQRIDVSEKETYFFVRSASFVGILPEMLEVLQKKRGEAKKVVKLEGKKAKDESLPEEERARAALAAVMADLLQKSIKICSNSIYGATGASVGSFPCIAISACTTAKGREAMVIKKEALPALFPELGARVIYGDTDSIFLTFEAAGSDVQKAGAMGEHVAAGLTKHFQVTLGWNGMELEHEKCFLPLHLQGKKRYFGKKYEPDPHAEVLMKLKGTDAKGVETQRRDTVPFVKQTLELLMRTLLDTCNANAAKDVLESQIQKLAEKKVNIDDLVQKQRISSKSEGKTDVNAAARVNFLREQREAGSAKKLNEWVETIFVVPADLRGRRKDAKATQFAEDADYARANPGAVKINYAFYFEKLRNPVHQVFAPFPDLQIPQLLKRYEAVFEAKMLEIEPLSAGDGGSLSELKMARYCPPDDPPKKKRGKKRA